MNVIIATNVPPLPMSSANPSNFYCNGVGELSYSKSALNLPAVVLAPTANTNIMPVPSITLVPDIKNGELLFY